MNDRKQTPKNKFRQMVLRGATPNAKMTFVLATFGQACINSKKDIKCLWQHDIQHNGTQHNNIQHNDIQHNDIQHNGIQHNDTQHNDTQHNGSIHC
jgi:hypothetical protein